MRTGMLAAETAFDAVRAGDTSAAALSRYQAKIDASPVRAELYPVRNVHQAFGYGLFAGAGLFRSVDADAAAGPVGRARARRARAACRRCAGITAATRVPAAASNATTVDRRLTFDKVTNVHFSGTTHDEDQPVHLLVHTDVCSTICGPEYGHPCIALLPGQRLRDRPRGRRHAAAADQRVELRALQDVRHHGSLPGDHLGAARGRRRTAIQRNVSVSADRDWRASRLRRVQVAAIAGAGYPLIAALGHTLRWRVEGLEHFDAHPCGGRQPVMAFWHGRILPATFYFRNRRHRRDHQRELRRRVDCAHHRALRLRHRARIDVARRAKALLQLVRDMRAGKPAGFTVDGPRGPAEVAQPGAVWLAKATGNPVLPFHLEASASWTLRSWDRTQIPKPFSTVAIAIGEPMPIARDADAAGLEAARVELERRLQALEQRALFLLNGA